MDEPVLKIKNQGVQIILNRMQSNPDEFTLHHGIHPGRWGWLLEQVVRRVEHRHQNDDNYRIELPFLSNDEVDALYDKWMSIQGDAFTHRIMRELLEEDGTEAIHRTSMEYDIATDTLRYGTGTKQMRIPTHMLEIAKRLIERDRR